MEVFNLKKSTYIGITGSDGFLAFHVRALLLSRGHENVVLANRADFENDAKLEQFVANSDVILHLAGINRSEVFDIYLENVRIAERLISAIKKSGRRIPVAFSSSIHEDNIGPYGQSKKKVSDLLSQLCREAGTAFKSFVFPNLFGEFGKPNYNSVVATFCHALAKSEPLNVVKDSTLSLLHVQMAASLLLEFAADPKAGTVRPEGHAIKVSDLKFILEGMLDKYKKHILPALNDRFQCDLFNTLRAFLFPSLYPAYVPVHADDRGYLFETVKGGGGGQSFISTSNQDILRGNHFHLRKMERFVVLEGKAEVSLRRVFSDKVFKFELDATKPSYLDIPTMYTHAIKNVGSGKLMTLFWTNELFDPANTDTYPEAV